jgi:hypothetical protein
LGGNIAHSLNAGVYPEVGVSVEDHQWGAYQAELIDGVGERQQHLPGHPNQYVLSQVAAPRLYTKHVQVLADVEHHLAVLLVGLLLEVSELNRVLCQRRVVARVTRSPPTKVPIEYAVHGSLHWIAHTGMLVKRLIKK